MNARNYFLQDRPEPIGKPQYRYAVRCWDTVQAYAFNRLPDAVVCVLAPDPENAQDSIKALKGDFDCYEVRLATKQDEDDGMTLSEFRDRYNTR